MKGHFSNNTGKSDTNKMKTMKANFPKDVQYNYFV